MPNVSWKKALKKGPIGFFLGREIWALLDQGIVSAVNFSTNVMLARFMGLREFGAFALAWMSVLLVNSLQTALIVAPMMSIGPKQKADDRPHYFGAVIVQEVVLVVACFFLVLLAVKGFGDHFKHPEIKALAWPLATSALAYQAQDFIRRYFFSTGQSQRALVSDSISYIPQVPVIFLLHHLGHLNSANALWVMAATSIIGLVQGSFLLESLHFSREWIVSVWRRHWKVSRWLAASSLLQWTSSNLFVVAAPLYYGTIAAGVLKASQNIMGVTHIWFQGLDNIVPVETARRLSNGGVRAMLEYTREILLKWGGITAVFALVMSAAPRFWLGMVYGPQILQYAYVLRLYAVLYIIVFVGGPMRAALQALEFTVPIFWSYLAMTAFAFAFAVPFAKRLGLSGSLLGLVATQVIFQSIVGIALFAKSRRLWNVAPEMALVGHLDIVPPTQAAGSAVPKLPLDVHQHPGAAPSQ